MPITETPKETITDYPDRSDEPTLVLNPGDASIENYYNASVLLTHDDETGSPVITITCRRKEERPNCNNDDAVILLSAGTRIDTEVDYSVKGQSKNIPNSGITKTIILNTDDIRVNSKKDTFVSSGKKITLSALDNITIEGMKDLKIEIGGNTKLTISGNIEIQANSITIGGSDIKIGQGASKKVVTSLFTQLFNSHTHPVPDGISGVPTTPLTNIHLSETVKVK